MSRTKKKSNNRTKADCRKRPGNRLCRSLSFTRSGFSYQSGVKKLEHHFLTLCRQLLFFVLGVFDTSNGQIAIE